MRCRLIWLNLAKYEPGTATSMSSTSFSQSLRRLWARDKFSYSVRVFIALTGSMAFCWYQDEMSLLIPLFLGIIASALSETDDSWQGRLNALLVTLVCFSASAFSVELLFPYPWLMVCALALASFGLTMLGALGERYGAIASATLILAVYTMIGVDQRGGEVLNFWHEPLLLVAGMDVVDAIRGVATTTKGPFRDVPAEPVTIESVSVVAGR